MQELLEELKHYKASFQNPIGPVIEKIENELLEKEKEVIMDAYNYGQQIPPFDYAEQYYNETFNTILLKPTKWSETFNTNQENLPDSTNGYTYYPLEHKTIFNTK